MLEQFHAEQGLAPLNIEKFRRLVMGQIDLELVFVADLDGEIIGGIGLRESEYSYSDHTYLHDFFIYILPEHRGGPEMGEFFAIARELSEAFGITCYLAVTNPDKMRLRAATLFGWAPVGYIMKLRVGDAGRALN